MDFHQVLYAFALTTFAGISTGIGGAIVFFAKKTSTKLLSVAFGFSAGVMIYVSFVEIFPQALQCIGTEVVGWQCELTAVLAFFGGVFVTALIDRLLPSFENPHEAHKVEDLKNEEERKRVRKLFRLGIFTALIIALHNFPEGLSTFLISLKDLKVGLAVAIAIAIHNIPEGISISVPFYYATGSKKKAFSYSFLSGLAEPIGAVFGYVFLTTFFSQAVFGAVLASVAGIMVFISLDQLLPAAREYGEHHLSVYGLVAGMAVMAFSLVII